MLRYRLNLALILLAAAGQAAADGDVMQMPPAAPPAAEHQEIQMDLPVKGMSMHQVEAKFGAPQEKIPAVGEPPISRWVYPDYTVYFERQYVLHTVLKRK